jgi:hypothetical protein
LALEGLDWRGALKDGDEHGQVDYALSVRLDEVGRREGEDRAGMLAQVAYGRATPIGPLADQWLAEKPLKAKQKLDYRRAVSKLEGWMAGKGQPPTSPGLSHMNKEFEEELFFPTGEFHFARHGAVVGMGL